MFHSSSTAPIKLKMVVITSRSSTSLLQCYKWEKRYKEKSNVVQKVMQMMTSKARRSIKIKSSKPSLSTSVAFFSGLHSENITVFICSAVILLLTGSYFHWRITAFSLILTLWNYQKRNSTLSWPRCAHVAESRPSNSLKNLNHQCLFVETENVTDILKNWGSFL